ncbi:MAG: hypothetical protein QME74_11490 [Candidatus Edwardsbacteria bacterium]|nr:hypothetical protein [Candidatus Edwardsbacteria bacterium]
MLFLQLGQLERAGQLSGELQKLAAEINNKEHRNNAKFLGLVIDASLKKDGAIECLEAFASGNASDALKAEAGYWLYRLTGEEKDGKMAQERYRRLCDSFPSYSNRARHAELVAKVGS